MSWCAGCIPDGCGVAIAYVKRVVSKGSQPVSDIPICRLGKTALMLSVADLFFLRIKGKYLKVIRIHHIQSPP